MCEGGCFSPLLIEVANVGKKETIDIIKGTVIKYKEDQSPDDLMHSALFIKDNFLISCLQRN